MKEIIVTSQAELDAVSTDFDGRIIIKFGTPYNRAVVNRAFKYPVKLYGSSTAVLYGSSSAVLWDSSSAELYGSSSAELYGSSSAELYGSSSAVLWGSSTAKLWDSSSAVLWDSSSAVLWDSSSAVLWGSSSAVLWGSSTAVLWDSSSAKLYGSSSAELYGSSSAVLWDSSTAELWGNSQALDVCRKGNIKTHGNSRIVYNPSNIDEYIDFHGVETEGDKVKLYKAVHFDGLRYYADVDRIFTYTIGETAKPTNGFNDNPNDDCGAGIHMAHKAWAVDYGRGWSDLAILELEVDKADIVVPLYGSGKVRARKAKVLREVPLEECGLLGKMLAKQKEAKETV